MPKSPEAFPQAFIEAWEQRSGAAIGALFAQDADFVNVTGLWWHGRDKIAKPHDYALNSFFAQTDLRAGRTEVRLLGANHAVVRCRFTLTGQRAPDGSEAEARQTILTFVLQDTAQGWQALSGQNTDVVPGQETMLTQEGTLAAVRYKGPPIG